MGAIKEICFGAICEMGNFLNNGGSMYKGHVEIDDSCDEQLTNDSTDEEVDRAFTNGISYDLEIAKGLRIIDKDEWIGFWRRYNLLQFFNPNIAVEQVDVIEKQLDPDEIKMFYPGMEDIVDILLDHNVPFSHDGMCELTDDDNEVIACADLLIDSPLIAINPVSENDKKVFEKKGYMVITKEQFNIEIIQNEHKS